MRFVFLLFALCSPLSALSAEPRLLVHYMPWYATKEVSGAWCWHWTMNHFDPELKKWGDQRKIASHDYPLIGPYDSEDDQALECQVLLMKIAGLDGVVIDWYGTSDLNDHAMNHRNSPKLIPWLKKAGLGFAVCNEDQPVKSLKNGEDAKQAQKDIEWAEEHFYVDSSYHRQNGRRVLLIFGPQHLKCKFDLNSKPLVFDLAHLAKEKELNGAFAWPPVKGRKLLSQKQLKKELSLINVRKDLFIDSAFPGFKDIYQQAGVHDSYGVNASRAGPTLTESLAQALESKAPIIQIATWKDYGEGTIIEPTRNKGFRQLEKMPRCGNPADLRLRIMFYQLRKRGGDAAKLDEAATLMFASKFTKTEAILASVSRELGKQIIDGGYHLSNGLLYREEKGISAKQSQRCRLDVYAPAVKKRFSTAIWFHGGGLTQGERSIPPPMRNQGIAVVSVNYRLSPGVKAPAFIEAAAAAIVWTFKHIADFGGDPWRIFVSGHCARAYLSLMCGLDKKSLAKHDVDADQIGGLIPLSRQLITHFSIRDESGIEETQPIIADFAPPILLVTGDHEKEHMGRYKECAYLWRMMKLIGHKQTTLHELNGFAHGKMAEPAFPLLLKFVNKPLFYPDQQTL